MRENTERTQVVELDEGFVRAHLENDTLRVPPSVCEVRYSRNGGHGIHRQVRHIKFKDGDDLSRTRVIIRLDAFEFMNKLEIVELPSGISVESTCPNGYPNNCWLTYGRNLKGGPRPIQVFTY
jgi:hypothetical protein